MPKTAKEIKEEPANPIYGQLGALLEQYEESRKNSERKEKIEAEDLKFISDALKTLSSKDKSSEHFENIVKNKLDILRGFNLFLNRKPKGSEYTNYQLLYEESYHTATMKDFQNLMGQVNQELGLGIDLEKLNSEIKNERIYKNINEEDSLDGSRDENDLPYKAELNLSADSESMISDDEEEKKKNNSVHFFSNYLINRDDAFDYGNEKERREILFQRVNDDDLSGYDSYVDVGDEAYTPLENVEKNAYDWIEGFKEDNLENGCDQRLLAARILAARMLVNSIRGDGNSLKVPVNGKDIDRVAYELLNNKDFNTFINGMNRTDLTDKISKFGHGGKLEDTFKEYLLKRPAGELNNDRILDRFMPTAWDRINELKSQAKKKGDDSILKEITETMVIRRMVGSGRNTPDKLKVKIPTVSSLREQVFNITFLEGLQELGYQDNVKIDFRDGHGGQMMMNMYNSIIDSPERKMLNEVKEPGTVDYKFKALQEEAGAIIGRLETEPELDSDEYKVLTDAAKEIVAQAIVISDAVSRKEKGNPNADNLNKQAPSDVEIQRGMEGLVKNQIFNDILFPDNAPRPCMNQLREFLENPAGYAKETNKLLRDAKQEILDKAKKKAEPEDDPLNTARIEEPPKPKHQKLFNI